jgi:hypothetical protein
MSDPRIEGSTHHGPKKIALRNGLRSADTVELGWSVGRHDDKWDVGLVGLGHSGVKFSGGRAARHHNDYRQLTVQSTTDGVEAGSTLVQPNRNL